MTFEEMYNKLNTLGVEVEWIDPALKNSFSAIINCETVIVSSGVNGLGEDVYTVIGDRSQYPAEYQSVDDVYKLLSTEWVIYSGTKFINIDPNKTESVLVKFSEIVIGKYFYHGGICLKISDSTYFNSRVISIKMDTDVSLCIAEVMHKPFVI